MNVYEHYSKYNDKGLTKEELYQLNELRRITFIDFLPFNMGEKINILNRTKGYSADELSEFLFNFIPIDFADLRYLFIYLSNEVNKSCDNNLSLTRKFLDERVINVDEVVMWLESNGGYCDCEVLMNVYDKFDQIVDWCLESYEE